MYWRMLWMCLVTAALSVLTSYLLMRRDVEKDGRVATVELVNHMIDTRVDGIERREIQLLDDTIALKQRLSGTETGLWWCHGVCERTQEVCERDLRFFKVDGTCKRQRVAWRGGIGGEMFETDEACEKANVAYLAKGMRNLGPCDGVE